eukprot:scaffold1887_cov239-Pinguiococcus_pyrenoidosus.AAC.4
MAASRSACSASCRATRIIGKADRRSLPTSSTRCTLPGPLISTCFAMPDEMLAAKFNALTRTAFSWCGSATNADT